MTAEAKYLSVQDLIKATVKQFATTKGGDRDELMGIANLTYAKIEKRWDGDLSKFSTWIRYNVWNAMLDHLRTEIGRLRRVPRTYVDDMDTAFTTPSPSDSQLKAMLDGLSKEARLVASLVVEDVPEITLFMRMRKRKNPTPSNYLYSIKEFLQDIGWSASEIATSFKEIKEAL